MEEKMMNKAIKMAVNSWFAETGELTESELYDWLQDAPAADVDYPDGVILSEAKEVYWPCNAYTEISELVDLLLDAMKYAQCKGDKQDEIHITWTVDDILHQMDGRDEMLTREQAKEILHGIRNKHDACIGINWDVIDTHISMYLSEHHKPFLPPSYQGVAEKLEVNTNYNPSFEDGADTRSLIFFEALSRDTVTPDNIEVVIEMAEAELSENTGSTIVEAVDEALFHI